MKYQKVIEGKFVDRPNRFIAHVKIDGELALIEDYIENGLSTNIKHTVYLVVDRIALKEENNDRLVEALELASKYGEGIINEYSKKLTLELGKGYNVTNLKRYRQFYLLIQKGARIGHQLSWSHYRELLSLDNIDKINYYIELCDSQIITRDELKKRIKSQDVRKIK